MKTELRPSEGTTATALVSRLTNEPALPPRDRRLDRSRALLRRARTVIPSASQTFSKAPMQFVEGVAPAFLARGKGSRVWDVDGNEYIDLTMGLAPVVLGYAHEAVTAAATRAAGEGVSLTLATPLEVELAETLVRLIPCAEMVRFGKNGSDATAGAVRVARAYTGRDVIAACGYHGWQDWFIGTTTRARGVPQAVRDLTTTFDYNDIASLERVFAKHRGAVAAVIMEPIGVVEPKGGFLQDVRDLCDREGALLIFDEIITGFRLALGGAQEHFGVIPDLGCFGKAMANGYPISAVVGRRDVMALFDEIFFSFTFGGEAVSLAASLATIGVLEREPCIPQLWEMGALLRDGFNGLAAAYGLADRVSCVGLAPRTVVGFKGATEEDGLIAKSFFQQECAKRGVLFTGGHNLSYAHDRATIEETLRVYRAALELLADAWKGEGLRARVEGSVVQAVFRRP